MNPQEVRNFILEQRSAGVPDGKIYDTLNQMRSITKERGIAGEILPTAGAIGGGIVGGIVGAPAGPAGIVAGRVGGAAIGGAAGELAQQGIEKLRSERDKIDLGQVAGTGVITGGIEAVAPPIVRGAGKVIGKVVSPVAHAIRPKVVQMMSKLSGYTDDVVKKALDRTPGTVKAIGEGEKALADLVNRSAAKISQFADDLLKQNKATLDKLSRTFSLGGKGQQASRNILLKEGNKFVDDITNTLRTNHNIGITKDGTLLFSRANQPSRIVAGGDQKALQEGFNLVRGIQKNTSIKNIDAVLERLIVLKSKTPVGSPTGTQTRAIINEMIGNIQRFTKVVYPEYFEHLTQTLPKRVMVNEAKDLFGGSKNLSPAEVSRISGRLLQLYNTGRLALREGVEEVGKEIGEDITGTVAGTIMKLDDAFSFRAQNLGTRSALLKVIESIPRKIVDTYVKTGKITGDLLQHEAVKRVANTLRISAKSAAQLIANQLANKEIK